MTKEELERYERLMDQIPPMVLVEEAVHRIIEASYLAGVGSDWSLLTSAKEANGALIQLAVRKLTPQTPGYEEELLSFSVQPEAPMSQVIQQG